MNKTLLSTGMAIALGIGAASAQAAFTPLIAGNYQATITGGCFAFGTCSDTGAGAFTDNTASQATTTVTAAVVTTRALGDTIGSGTVGGDNGQILFTLDGSGNFTVSSYRQDSYLSTAGGTFFVDALGPDGTSLMTGNISGSGVMNFTPTGREGMAFDFYSTIGVQPWNIIPGDTATQSFTTGTQTAVKGKSSVTMTGSALQDVGDGTWTGAIVSAGNVNGTYWTGFDNTLYTEQFNLTIACIDPEGTGCNAVSPIPVPAAVWLFGSGLLGLVGVARRRKGS